MCRMCDELSVTITDTRTTLPRVHVCANSDEQDLYNYISHLIHTLNSDWFQYLKLIKENKLIANSPEQTTHQEPNIEDNDTSEVDKVVKTIPENLNLSEAEKSVLKKGLNFIPIKPTTDEFTSKEDCEKFYRRLRLKAFFHDKNQDYSPLKTKISKIVSH